MRCAVRQTAANGVVGARLFASKFRALAGASTQLRIVCTPDRYCDVDDTKTQCNNLRECACNLVHVAGSLYYFIVVMKTYRRYIVVV